jgi:hypothetical protein
MSIGTAALKFYQEFTGIKLQKPTKITDHRTSGPKHGRAYQVMWKPEPKPKPKPKPNHVPKPKPKPPLLLA